MRKLEPQRRRDTERRKTEKSSSMAFSVFSLCASVVQVCFLRLYGPRFELPAAFAAAARFAHRLRRGRLHHARLPPRRLPAGRLQSRRHRLAQPDHRPGRRRAARHSHAFTPPSTTCSPIRRSRSSTSPCRRTRSRLSSARPSSTASHMRGILAQKPLAMTVARGAASASKLCAKAGHRRWPSTRTCATTSRCGR